MSDLSDDPTGKLQAAINHDWPDHDDDPGEPYCAWFARLSEGERWRLARARAAFERCAEAKAEQLAAALPPAPVFPV